MASVRSTDSHSDGEENVRSQRNIDDKVLNDKKRKSQSHDVNPEPKRRRKKKGSQDDTAKLQVIYNTVLYNVYVYYP